MLEGFSKQFKVLNKIAGFITTISIIGGAYYYYRTTIWRPTVQVLSTDWNNGIATIKVGNNKIITLYKNQTVAIGGDFGVKFSGDDDTSINRIELYKNWLTYSVLAQKV